MDTGASASELRAALNEVERDLENLRASAARMRADVGDADDPTDRGALIQQADELDGLADQLIGKRDRLRKQLGEG
ncbi:MAG TPA: hypothetical protein VFQ44_26185 [Streptosporangiaceae bacterium]|nr:hypothetical protein [Streptosporangiaceae bacterium]